MSCGTPWLTTCPMHPSYVQYQRHNPPRGSPSSCSTTITVLPDPADFSASPKARSLSSDVGQLRAHPTHIKLQSARYRFGLARVRVGSHHLIMCPHCDWRVDIQPHTVRNPSLSLISFKMAAAISFFSRLSGTEAHHSSASLIDISTTYMQSRIAKASCRNRNRYTHAG